MSVDAVVFWGASGQAKVLRETLGSDGPRLIALFDNHPAVTSPWPDVPLYRGWRGFLEWREAQADVSRVGFLVAIGGDKGAERLQLQRDLARHGLSPLSAVHRTAFVAPGARIGAGSQILVGSIVAVDCELGEACIVNTGASVDHECVLGDGVHVCPGAHLAGCVSVGELVMIGTGAVVLPRVKIGARAIVGAGAVVTRDVPPGVTVVGNPARPREKA
jgi:sugar O-acyltransferase (sialic acid O-acetyltransferase NeuD family)